jgi:hypothetical protein
VYRRAFDVEWIGRIRGRTSRGKVKECLRSAPNCHDTSGFSEIESFSGDPRASFLDGGYRQDFDLALSHR